MSITKKMASTLGAGSETKTTIIDVNQDGRRARKEFRIMPIG
jgi:hypothetical protein